jgi:hypothetical protein
MNQVRRMAGLAMRMNEMAMACSHARRNLQPAQRENVTCGEEIAT